MPSNQRMKVVFHVKHDQPTQSRVHTLAYGHVQGVGFRAFVRHHARKLGLAGYCRNLPDGSVETEAEGTPEAIRELLLRLRRGPEGARVISLEELPPGSAPLAIPFEIRR